MQIEIIGNLLILKKLPFRKLFSRKRIVSENEINFINLENDPIFLCINNKEILFIDKTFLEQIRAFAQQFN